MPKSHFFPCAISIYPNLHLFLSHENVINDDKKPIEYIAEMMFEYRDHDVEIRNISKKILFRNLYQFEENTITGKIAIFKRRQKSEDDGENLYNVSITDYPYISFVLSVTDQIIYIQNPKYRIGINIRSLTESLEKIFGKMLYNMYSVEVRILPAKGRFWNIINKSRKIEYIEFELLAPNIAGKTANEIKDTLTELKNKRNITSVTEKQTNKDGDLEVDQDDDINARLQTVEGTGGVWKIKADKKTHKSNDKYMKETEETLRLSFGSKVIERIEEELKSDDEYF